MSCTRSKSHLLAVLHVRPCGNACLRASDTKARPPSRKVQPPPSQAAAWHQQQEALLQDVTAALGRTTAGAGAVAEDDGAAAAADHAMHMLLVPSAIAACSFVPAPSHNARSLIEQWQHS